MQNIITIGLSKSAANYEKWLLNLDKDVRLVDFYTMTSEEAMKTIGAVSGLLLTGGSDIHPSLYGRPDDVNLCRNIDQRRDELELALLEAAFKLGLPILGICRGLQILNVARQGSLVVDIPSYRSAPFLHYDKEDVSHDVRILENSLLCECTGSVSGVVNSAHHQAADVLGSNLVSCSFSTDHIIEAIEFDQHINYPFCIAVQWHPERMDMNNPLSGKLGAGFIEAMRRR